ncbi:MAG: permease [Armatimonadetes bacterium]|nr:permease [Armatimonadota bacterium]
MSITRSEGCAVAPARPAWQYLGAGAAAVGAWWLLYQQLEVLAGYLTYELLGLGRETHLGSSVAFFLFEVPKVLMLLVLVVFGIGIVRSHFTPERTRRLLAGRREATGNVLAALLGVVTPFCSCSAVPLFIGFVEAGIPLGVTLSFLIAAPMVNEVALVLLFGLFGARVALLYLGTGLLIATVAGWVIGRLHMERHVEEWVYSVRIGEASGESGFMTGAERLRYAAQAARAIVGKVWPFVVAGIAVGAGIHGYAPEGLLASIMGKGAWWSVPAAVLLGVPMYSNAAGIVPVVQALIEKGAALGTALAFMMAVIALSLPEMVILRRVLKGRLIATFAAVVATGILLVGWLFNLLL